MTSDQLIDGIVEREGGFVNNPADAGGPTNFGITQATLAAYRGHPVLAEDVKNLTLGEARIIYAENYLAPFMSISDCPLRTMVVDCAVNMGVHQATILLQRALGVPVDGKVGPQTIAAANRAGNDSRPLAAQRIVFYADRVSADGSQRQFLPGWVNRTLSLV